MKLHDNTWNCSVPYRADFLYHLTCNMEVECDGAEDERRCSYTTELCGPGYITLGGACFFYVWKNQDDISFPRDYDECYRRGGIMPVFSTVTKVKDAARMLPKPSCGEYVGYPLEFLQMPLSRPQWYGDLVQWSDETTAFGFDVGVKEFVPGINVRRKIVVRLDHAAATHILCEKQIFSKPSKAPLHINGTNYWPHAVKYVECPLGHFTHLILACDVGSSCWSRDTFSPCGWSVTPLPPSFLCRDQIQHVPYTLVCDHREHCKDNSDEDFCTFPSCRYGQIDCGRKQCVSRSRICDRSENCANRADERGCGHFHRSNVLGLYSETTPIMIGKIKRLLRIRGYTEICPSTHFLCQDGEFCLPLYLRCNGFYDCPDHGDETGCETCPGFYRCRDSTICLASSQLCDGYPVCLQHDDELLCGTACPEFCVCRGLSFFCSHSFNASSYPLVRFLDASNTNMTPAYLTGNRLLIHLILDECGLESVQGLHLPNLLILEIQDNQLSDINRAHFEDIPQLSELNLAGNPVSLVLEGSEQEVSSFRRLLKLDLSRALLHDLNATALSTFPSLHVLNLSHSGLQYIRGDFSQSVKQLRILDARGCPIEWFPRGMFQGLDDLQTVYGDSFKICCSAVLPQHFNVHNCFSPSDEISSCDNLLTSKGNSICVFIYSLLTVGANGASFICRALIARRGTKNGYGVFVSHLSVSDFLMGVYLVIIGVADQVYRGTYVWNDAAWKHSATCKVAGCLSLLSSEVSALIMCLITIDRFLVLRFPFSRLHFTYRSAQMSSGVVWFVGMVLVSIPLLPMTSHWKFYSQTGICIPLPITRKNFSGRYYSFGIMIVFNFVVFVFISLGQMGIYCSVRANAMPVSNTTKKSKDLAIARRLIAVAMTDFMCWFPIGVLGLLASTGFPIPGEANAALAIFVLPLNSAVNPCLYTANIILERRRCAREKRLRAILVAQLKT